MKYFNFNIEYCSKSLHLYKTLETCQPSYLYNLLQLHQPSRALRSSTQQLLQVPSDIERMISIHALLYLLSFIHVMSHLTIKHKTDSSMAMRLQALNLGNRSDYYLWHWRRWRDDALSQHWWIGDWFRVRSSHVAPCGDLHISLSTPSRSPAVLESSPTLFSVDSITVSSWYSQTETVLLAVRSRGVIRHIRRNRASWSITTESALSTVAGRRNLLPITSFAGPAGTCRSSCLPT